MMKSKIALLSLLIFTQLILAKGASCTPNTWMITSDLFNQEVYCGTCVDGTYWKQSNWHAYYTGTLAHPKIKSQSVAYKDNQFPACNRLTAMSNTYIKANRNIKGGRNAINLMGISCHWNGKKCSDVKNYVIVAKK